MGTAIITRGIFGMHTVTMSCVCLYFGAAATMSIVYGCTGEEGSIIVLLLYITVSNNNCQLNILNEAID